MGKWVHISRLLFSMFSQTWRGGLMLESENFLTGGIGESVFLQNKAKIVKGLDLHLFRLIPECGKEQAIYWATLNTPNTR